MLAHETRLPQLYFVSVRECVLVAMGTQSESQSQAFAVSLLIFMRRSGVNRDTPLRMPSPAPLLLPTTSGSKQYGRPREEVLRELLGRCYEFADSLCRMPGYWTLSGVLLCRCRNRQPQAMARLSASWRRALLALGSRGRGRMDQQGRAVAARCHRAIWIWKLGTILKWVHIDAALINFLCMVKSAHQYKMIMLSLEQMMHCLLKKLRNI